MSKCFLPLIAIAIPLGFSGCGTSVDNDISGTGPFDDRGNYIEEWADNPSKWNGRSVPTPTTKTQPTEVASNTSTPSVVQARPTQSSSTTVSNPTPKPVVKPKPRPAPKPSSTYHTVRKGDTLYGLAKKYGTSVGVIQRANGISGSTIRIGQKLKIPR